LADVILKLDFFFFSFRVICYLYSTMADPPPPRNCCGDAPPRRVHLSSVPLIYSLPRVCLFSNIATAMIFACCARYRPVIYGSGALFLFPLYIFLVFLCVVGGFIDYGNSGCFCFSPDGEEDISRFWREKCSFNFPFFFLNSPQHRSFLLSSLTVLFHISPD